MSSTQKTRAINLVSTGSEPLDEILGGGLPEGSTTVIAGRPGSGKTALALKMAFSLAERGLPVLYVTTLSEPSLKLLRYLESYSFFDADLADRWVEFMDVGAQLLKAPDDAFTAITERVRDRGPALIVIDSFRAIHDVLPEGPAPARGFIYRLAVSLASMGATTLLLGAYTQAELDLLPEFAIADGIIRLGSQRNELASTREMEILKLRGRAYVTGIHSFDITSDGLVVYPRVRAPEASPTEAPAERLPTGIAGLDDLLDGGLPARSATVVQGATGTGKTVLSLAFLLEGIRRGEPGIYFGMDETQEHLRELARSLGWDLADLEARGLLFLRYSSPVELAPDRYLFELRRDVTRAGARRVVVDSLSTMETGVNSLRRYKELVYSLSKHMRASGVTLVMAVEVPETMGETQLTGHAVSSIADNVILIRYVELGGRLGKTITVLKARGLAHKTELRLYSVAKGGPHAGESLGALRGVLTGLPIPSSQTDIPR